MGLYIDALSVYAAVTATFIKVPAEKSLLSHVQYVRERLDRRVLQYLFWLDTRDMIADGLTKGTVDRGQLHQLMEGLLNISKPCKQWCHTGRRENQLVEPTEHRENQQVEPTEHG